MKIVGEILKKKEFNRMPIFELTEMYFGFRDNTAKSAGDLDTRRILVKDMGEIWTRAKIEVINLSELPRPPKVKKYFLLKSVIVVVEMKTQEFLVQASGR